MRILTTVPVKIGNLNGTETKIAREKQEYKAVSQDNGKNTPDKDSASSRTIPVFQTHNYSQLISSEIPRQRL